MLEEDPKNVEMDIVGLNHHFFVTDVFVDGKSKIKYLLDKYISGELQSTPTMSNIESLQWSKTIIEGLKAIPNPYHSYYFMTKEQLELEMKQYESNDVRAETVKEIESELFEIYANEELDVKPKRLEERGGAYYSDAACSLINSIVNNKQDIQYVITKNNGTVSNLDYDNIIETAAIITNDGPRPLTYGKIPYALNGTIQTIKTFELMTAEAAVTGDRALVITALSLNQLIDSDSTAQNVFDDLYEAHKEYLPTFNK